MSLKDGIVTKDNARYVDKRNNILRVDKNNATNVYLADINRGNFALVVFTSNTNINNTVYQISREQRVSHWVVLIVPSRSYSSLYNKITSALERDYDKYNVENFTFASCDDESELENYCKSL